MNVTVLQKARKLLIPLQQLRVQSSLAAPVSRLSGRACMPPCAQLRGASARGCASAPDRPPPPCLRSSAAGGEGFANRVFAAYASISAAGAADAADSKRVRALARPGESRVPSSQSCAESPLRRGFRAAAAVNASCPTRPQSPAGGPVSADRACVFSRSGYRFGGRHHDWRAAE